MKCDIWIKNGRIVDPKRGLDEKGDVFILNSRIISRPPNESVEAEELVDAEGCLVLPGLIDFHTHLDYLHSEVGISPDLMTLPNGITAAVDAGTTGPANYEGFLKTIVRSSDITIRSFMNVSSAGIMTEQFTENLEPERFDVKRMMYLFERYPEELLGLKVRIGKDFSKELKMKPLTAAIEIAEKLGRPVCVHAVYPENSLSDIVNVLRAGDILCHCFQGKGPNNILDGQNVFPAINKARERGVIFDSAAGRANYNFKIAQAAINDGFPPDVISTDVVTFSIYRRKVFCLLYTMSAYLGLGMPLMEVVKACTATPAKLMNLENSIGTLSLGALADVAIVRIRERPITFNDQFGNSVVGDKLLCPQMTIKAGRIAFRQIDFTF